MDDYLSKPFDSKQLHAALARWLDIELDCPLVNRDFARHPIESELVIDGNKLDSIRSIQPPGMPNILNRVINIYLENSVELLELIRVSLAKNDNTALLEAAHSLKSSSANLGATDVALTCKKLEGLAKQGPLESAKSLFEQLTVEYDITCSELRKELME